MTDSSSNFNTDGIFRRVAEGTAATTGGDFLQALLAPLAEVLAVEYAFISEFTANHTRARVLAWWHNGSYSADEEYALAGTPCETVLDGQVHCYLDRVAELFPGEPELAELGIRSYMATPLLNGRGTVLGHLAIMDVKPMRGAARDLDVFRIFGARAGAELERQRVQEALHASERRLGQVINSAMDAIVTLDEDMQIEMFNPAAERIFGCAAADATGGSFERFLTAEFRDALRAQLSRTASVAATATFGWSPAGLMAQRADGHRFPVEYTLSPLGPVTERRFALILRDVNELRRLEQAKTYLQREAETAHPFADMVGRSPLMRELFSTVSTVARTDSTVLISGETGTGKEHIAQALHQYSRRVDAMLVKMNCAALPAELIESELFGHEKGAFSGATAQRRGRFELADGGSLFLDEVGELSLPAQAKLLRVLQEQEFERVGGSQSIKVDVRVIAATNRDLAGMVRTGSFRADLYYRLNVFPLRVPPLRERRSDLDDLVRHFLDLYSRKLGKPLRDLDAASRDRILRYDWPGNIRELQNVIERAAVLATGDVLQIRDLAIEDSSPWSATDERSTLEAVEAAHIQRVLEATAWVIEGRRGAAAILDMEPSTLRSRMRKLGINRPLSSATRG